MARGSITRTGNGRYRARLSYTDGAGTRRHRSKTFTTKKLAETWLRKTIDRIEQGQSPDEVLDTVAEVYGRWIAHIERTRAPSTAYHYAKWYRLLIEPAFGAYRVGAVKAVDIQRLYDRLADTYAPATLQVVHRVVRGIFKTAKSDGLITDDPSADRRVPNSGRNLGTAWTTAESRRFLTNARAGVDDIWVFMLVTGLRVGEVRALQWDAVDLRNRRVEVRRTMQTTEAGERIADTTKTAASRRSVALGDIAIDVLRRQVRRLDTPLVFPDEDGQPRPHRTLLHQLRRACEAAGVPEITPHGLRHAAATLMLHAGVSPKVAAEQLGHSSIAITMDLYSHVSDELAHQAARAVDEILGIEDMG